METNESKNNVTNVGNEKKALKLPNLPVTKLIPLAIIVGVVVVATSVIAFSKPSMTTTITSIMTSQEVKSQLSVLQVPYGGIYYLYDEKDKEIDQCLYRGWVKYTIDFNKIKFSEQDKTIKIEIPNVELKRENVHIDAETKWLHRDRYKNDMKTEQNLCIDDIIQKYKNDEETKKLAEQTVTNTITKFIEPIVKGIDKQYKVEVSIGGGR